MKQKKFLFLGSFEFLHEGHVRVIQFCKKLGHVAVGIDSDEYFKKIKRREPKVKLERRIAALKHVIDEIHVYDDYEKVIEESNATCLVLGIEHLGKKRFEKISIPILYLMRTPGISSTLIRKAVKDE